MTTYQRRTTFAEAEQWNDTPESTATCIAFLETIPHGLDIGLDVADSGHASANALFYCAKSNARVHIEPGDWIIKESDGSGFYPCTRDVFYASYDLPANKRSV